MQSEWNSQIDHEGDHQVKRTDGGTADSPSRRLRIDIPNSPTVGCLEKCAQDGVDTVKGEEEEELNVECKLEELRAIMSTATDQGRQMTSMETSNAISSRELPCSHCLRFLRNVTKLDDVSGDYPTDFGNVAGLSKEDPLQAISLTDLHSVPPEGSNHSKKNNKAPSLAAEIIPEDFPYTPMTPRGTQFEEAADPSTNILREILRDASQVHGIQLKWVLCSVALVVIIIFFVSLGQVQILVKNNNFASEQQVVEMSAAAAVNQLEWLQQSIRDLMRQFPLTAGVSVNPSASVIISQLCASIGGSPLLFASYSEVNASLVWSYVCPGAIVTNVDPPQAVKIDYEMPGTLRMAVYRSKFLIAMLTSRDTGKTLVVILQKEPVGRLLLANSLPSYSSSALRHSSTSLILPEFSSSLVVVALHSLNSDYTNYSVTQPTILGQRLHEVFSNICSNGEAYTWHIVRRPTWNESFVLENGIGYPPNKIPNPYVEYRGVWGGVLRVSVCGILCTAPVLNHCSPTNPTSMRFVLDNVALVRETDVVLTAVSVVSVVAIMLFLAIIMTAYASISIPIQHLKSLVFNAFGGKRRKTSREHLIFHYTRQFWLGDLQALVRAFQVLLFCFQLNKKYVPPHILKRQMLALKNCKDYLCHEIVEGVDVEEEDDDASEDIQVGIKAFLNTVSAADPRHGATILSASDAFLRSPGTESRREGAAGGYHTIEADADETGSSLGMTYSIETAGGGMTIVGCGTILAVHLCAIERAYFTDHEVATKQHRRIMNLLLGQIRHYRGELFERSGDCIAAAWNAFESCADHAERAASCALRIASLLSQYRWAGLPLGIVLHQGPFVCGVVQDNRAAFTTVFGTVPRQAIALAELAASLPCFNVLISEPVKKTLSSLYECILVDIIKYHEDDTPIGMFEISEERRLPPVLGTPLSPSAFVEEHVRVFYCFRNHKFEEALASIEQLRLRFPKTRERLLRRIELLCRYYMQHTSELPLPYFRLYPTWPNYEAIASADVPSEMSAQGSREEYSLENSNTLKISKYMYEDDTVRFRQELYDNVLASKRMHGSGVNVRELNINAVGSGVTNRWGTTSPSTAVPDQLFHPEPSTFVEKRVLPTLVERAERPAPVVSTDESGACMPKPILTNSNFEEELMRVEMATEGGSTAIESLSSEYTEREVVDRGDRETGSTGGHQRFSFTNRLPSTVFEPRNRDFLGAADAVASTNEDITPNIASFSVGDVAGSLPRVADDLPTEFVAKDGITYLRSSRSLGRGSCGRVYLGMAVPRGKMVAIKFLPLPSREEEVVNVGNEVVTLQKVKSKHVVQFISYAFQVNLIIIVMECMMAGSLQELISAYTSIPPVIARLFIQDVLCGLHKLHSMGIIHRDVKPQNVLLTLAGNCKISDFGASAFLQEIARRQIEGKGLQVQGTPVYLAPEAARGKPEEKSDIWSCGIMFVQMVTGKLPYAESFLQMPPQILVFQIGSGTASPIVPADLDASVLEFVRHCLQVDPKERLSAKQLLELPLFSL